MLISCASLLKVLGVASRLEILVSIASNPASVGTLAKRLGLECSLLSHHLRPLRDAGFVTATQEGHRRVYRLGPSVCAHTITEATVELTLCGHRGSVLRLQLPASSLQVSTAGGDRAHPYETGPLNGVLREPKPERRDADSATRRRDA
ncbi:MAG: winged helix-turn-helix transcriptional regulator [Planctomycetota bacterium]|nr:MAG: winged helix-turn-helix transcriptional regulator [Planctomycetota bacterium]